MIRRIAIGLLVVLGVACAPSTMPTSMPLDPELVGVASELCPIMWRWQLAVGQILNDMSSASYEESDAAARRSLYTAAFDQVRSANSTLRHEISGLSPGPYVDLLAEEIVNGIAGADSVIDEIENTVAASYSATPPPTYHEMVPTIFMSMEKVIDIAKPELAGYANDDLIAAFISVPQCQHGVKDANDGIPRYVPLQ